MADNIAFRCNWQPKMCSIVERTTHLFNNPQTSDVSFIFKRVQDIPVKIYGHKFILGMSSPVFYETFYHNDHFSPTSTSKEENLEIQMTENKDRFFDSIAFLNFIKFFYTDEIAFPELSVETINIGIMFCSETYDVRYVAIESGKALLNRLKLDNVILLLETALRFKDLELEKKCWIMIDTSAHTVLQSDAILTAKMETLFEIIRRTTLAADETEVLDSCLKWSEKECERNGLDVTEANKKQVLNKVFYEIRFPILPGKKIAELVRSNFLSYKESSDMHILKICGGDVLNGEDRNLTTETPFKMGKRAYRMFFHR